MIHRDFWCYDFYLTIITELRYLTSKMSKPKQYLHTNNFKNHVYNCKPKNLTYKYMHKHWWTEKYLLLRLNTNNVNQNLHSNGRSLFNKYIYVVFMFKHVNHVA